MRPYSCDIARPATSALHTHEASCVFVGIQRKLHWHPGKIWSLMRFVGSPQIANGHPRNAMWERM